MGEHKQAGLTGNFTKTAMCASATALFLMTSGCTTKAWSGNPPPPRQQNIEAPLLTPPPHAKPRIRYSQASQTISDGALVNIDNALHSNDSFTVNRMSFTGSNGGPQNAYLTLPQGKGPFPLVLVFPVLSEKREISEVLGKEFARQGYAVLRVEGYYLALDKVQGAEQAMDRFRNTILDARMLLEDVKKLPQINEDKIAVAGVSLGSIMSATTMGIEPDIKAGAFMLGGGGLSEILHDSGQHTIESFRRHVFEKGLLDISTSLTGGIIHMIPGLLGDMGYNEDMTLEEITELLKDIHKIETRDDFITFTRPYTKPYDPLTYAPAIDSCRTMLLSGQSDKVIPPENTKELWEGLGRPEWHEVPSGHYDFLLYFYWSTKRAVELFDRVLNDKVCDEPNRSRYAAARP